MTTTEVSRAQSLIESLRALTVPDLRRAFPSHERVAGCQLVYDARGLGHIRTIRTGAGPRTLCDIYGDILPGDYTLIYGKEALHRATCVACYTEGLILRDAVEEEREPLRVAIAHARAISSVLDGLREAA